MKTKGKTFAGFGAETLHFLDELARNNNRKWFQKNKERYELEFIDPALQFITAMQKPIAQISSHYQAVPKKVGGSLMRIYKDVRFSKDKSPYKTNMGIQFRHVDYKSVHGPGFYFHLEPEEAFVAAGCWRPEPKTLAAIRALIAEEPARWKKVSSSKSFTKFYELHGDSLKRPPRGYAADHPAIEALKRKHFLGLCKLEIDQVFCDDFVKHVTKIFKAAVPMTQFLCEAAEIPF